jgi:hypothetical protein
MIDAWNETKKLLPREDDTPERNLRPESLVGKTFALLQKAGKPLHVSEILKRLNEPTTKEKRLSLSGSLAAYVRRNEIFTRPAPNTFGLKSMEEVTTPNKNGSQSDPETAIQLNDR